MGCGVSRKSQQYDQDVLSAASVHQDPRQQDCVVEILPGASEDPAASSMFSRRKAEDNPVSGQNGEPAPKKEETDAKRTLENKIHTFLSVPEEDAKEALSLAERCPDLQDKFHHAVNILHDVIRNDVQEFVEQLMTVLRGGKDVVDFLALVGGAKATADVYAEQLKSMDITHLTDELLNDVAEQRHETAMNVVTLMRHFWIDATDCSLEFAGRLAQTSLLSVLAEDLKNMENDFLANSSVFDQSLSVFHNCARNRQTKHCFRDIGAVQLLTPFLAREEKDIKLLTLLTLSYIIDEEDSHLLFADASDFDFLLEAVLFAQKNRNHRDPNGYSLEELLQGLGNLAQNDDNKKLLMEKDVLSILKPILQTCNDGERQEAGKIVWNLAFNKENRSKMKKDTELMDQLETMKNDSHRGVAKACGGALWVLSMDKKLHKDTDHEKQSDEKPKGNPAVPLAPPLPPGGGLPPPPPPSSPHFSSAPPAPLSPTRAGVVDRGHVMISYQWGNQKTLLQIRDSLRSEGFRVWIDVDNISGSTLQAMAEAVEKAEVVLMSMSQRYKDSPNCRTEAEYAFELQKPIIPLLMERNYKPDGWLGILRGSKLFFDFSGKYPYEKKLDDLVKELGQRGQAGSTEVDGPISGEKVRPVASTPVMTVNAWAQKDVHNWLNKHQLSGCPKLQSLTGEHIKFLQKLSLRAPEFFFSYLKQDLGLTSLTDLMHFSEAVDKLP